MGFKTPWAETKGPPPPFEKRLRLLNETHRFPISIVIRCGGWRVRIKMLYLGWTGGDIGVGNEKLLQYSCLENSIDWGASWAMVHRVTIIEQLRVHTGGAVFHPLPTLSLPPATCISEGKGTPASVTIIPWGCALLPPWEKQSKLANYGSSTKDSTFGQFSVCFPNGQRSWERDQINISGRKKMSLMSKLKSKIFWLLKMILTPRSKTSSTFPNQSFVIPSGKHSFSTCDMSTGTQRNQWKAEQGRSQSDSQTDVVGLTPLCTPPGVWHLSGSRWQQSGDETDTVCKSRQSRRSRFAGGQTPRGGGSDCIFRVPFWAYVILKGSHPFLPSPSWPGGLTDYWPQWGPEEVWPLGWDARGLETGEWGVDGGRGLVSGPADRGMAPRRSLGDWHWRHVATDSLGGKGPEEPHPIYFSATEMTLHGVGSVAWISDSSLSVSFCVCLALKE